MQPGNITCKIALVRNRLTAIPAVLVAGCLIALLAAQAPRAEAPGETWLLVDTVNLKLLVMEGTRAVHTFEGISIGRYGVTRSKLRGDSRTPVGRFRIAWIREDSRFHRFLGLDYPDLASARRAWEDNRIDAADWRAIQRAFRDGEVPPQHTPLGGQIGIHGVGEGDPAVHGQYNWTNGCVALTNEQLDNLSEWVHIGTRVDIR